MSTRIRAKQIVVQPELMSQLVELWERLKKGEHPKSDGVPVTFESWGQTLAKLVGRPKAFTKGQLSKFFAECSGSEEIAIAIAMYFGIPSPVLLPRSIAELDWFGAGQILSRLEPEEFSKLLRLVKAKAALAIEERDLLGDLPKAKD